MMQSKSSVILFGGFVALFAAQAVCAQSAKPATVIPAKSAPPIRAEPVPPQVEAAFDAWDVDHNGSLSRQEFIAGWQQLRHEGEMRREGAMQQRLRAQFNTLDADKSGALDAHEYAQMALVKRAGTAAPSFSTFDANKNGRLEFGEYLNLIRQLATRSAPQPATAAPVKKP